MDYLSQIMSAGRQAPMSVGAPASTKVDYSQQMSKAAPADIAKMKRLVEKKSMVSQAPVAPKADVSNKYAMAAQMAAPMIEGVAGSGVSQSMSGAAMGFQLGGAKGAVIGAVAGGVMGLMGAAQRRKDRRLEGQAQALEAKAMGETQKANIRRSMSNAISRALLSGRQSVNL